MVINRAKFLYRCDELGMVLNTDTGTESKVVFLTSRVLIIFMILIIFIVSYLVVNERITFSFASESLGASQIWFSTTGFTNVIKVGL